MQHGDGSSSPPGNLAPEFQQLWEGSTSSPDVFHFLSRHPSAAMDEKVDVLRVDQKYRWKTGKPLSLQTYLRRLPSLAERLDLIRKLIAGDQSCRRESLASGSTSPGQSEAGGSTESATQVVEMPGSLLETMAEEPPRSGEATSAGHPAATTPPVRPSEIGGGGGTTGTTGSGGDDRLDFQLDSIADGLRDRPRLGPVLASTRFTPIRRLGAGGMGFVFEAYDEERGEVVAIKTMRRVDPAGLFRFKGEFRSLSDLTHPNLVQFHQLFAVDDCWFLTMELVDGCDFLAYVRGDSAPAFEDATRLSAPREPTRITPTPPASFVSRPMAPLSGTALGVGIGMIEPATEEPPTHPSPPPLDLARFRSALIQLSEGLQALHTARKLHRDIKPTNVLVTDEGRVVILDFGLAADLEPGFLKGSPERDRQVVGTLAHMSPEQSLGMSITPASDWYSVGVIVYQALTGRLPYCGTFDEVIIKKQRSRPTPPDEIVRGLPPDLVSLCMDLLEREPDRRPTGSQVLERLTGEAGIGGADPERRRVLSLIGRDWHRQVLRSAYAALREGQAPSVFIYGGSGTGKTALVRSFLDELAANEDVVILAGRCYEQEWVPFKAVDSLVDALARHLKTLPKEVLDEVLPADAWLLARIFPVLRGVERILQGRRPTTELPDPQEMRLRVFSAFRKLFQRLGRISRLVLAVDDLQWGDADGAVLISDLLDGPNPPRMLFLGCFRQEEMAQSRLLQTLRQVRAEDRPAVWHRDLYVQPLTQVESRSLALALLGVDDQVALLQAHLAARESGGNPLFIEELIKHLQSAGPGHEWDPSSTVDLESALWSRIRTQPVDAQRLLEAIAVSGRPIRETLAFRAAGLDAGGRVALGALRSSRLVRGIGPSRKDQVETYHDRIRETVLAHLSPEALRGIHERLAEVLEGAGLDDPEVLAGHLQGAGLAERAAALYVQAAEKAMEALAFDHAVRLYRRALELEASPPAEVRRLHRRLGAALASNGRGAEAAAAYLLASEGTTAAEGVELTRLASTQLLISGHVDEGLALLRTILRPLCLNMPPTPRRALLSLTWHRTLLRLRGLRFRPRDETQVSAVALTRIDLCWSAVAGLSVIDPILGADFQTRGLLLALKAGEPFRIARALAMEAAHRSTAGLSTARYADSLLARAERLAGTLDRPEARGVIAMVRGVTFLMRGDWRPSIDAFEIAETLFRDHCTGVTWERNTVRCLELWSMLHAGRLAELEKRWSVFTREAEERGDLYATTTLTSFFLAMIRLAQDRPAEIRAELERAMSRWRRQGFFVQHSTELVSLLHLDLYQGSVAAAWERINAAWPAYTRSLLPRIQVNRIQLLELHARAALAMAEGLEDNQPHLLAAEEDARKLEREGQGWAIAHSRFIRAGIAAVREDATTASYRLEQAAALYDTVDMPLSAAVMRYRIGEIVGSSEGKALIARSESVLREQSIAAPERWARMIAPGFARIAASRVETSL
ncbi:serine/threonine-protein kinase [Aquisphaera insulae]|uniref:serine/threonine-protein kinase n=1 Tax=Aquisphaera insulae TaxID=2712864 RepID=UPI0013EC8F56|nr:serine/threonine-protein kinase [Aquisphaera insulae]